MRKMEKKEETIKNLKKLGSKVVGEIDKGEKARQTIDALLYEDTRADK